MKQTQIFKFSSYMLGGLGLVSPLMSFSIFSIGPQQPRHEVLDTLCPNVHIGTTCLHTHCTVENNANSELGSLICVSHPDTWRVYAQHITSTRMSLCECEFSGAAPYNLYHGICADNCQKSSRQLTTQQYTEAEKSHYHICAIHISSNIHQESCIPDASYRTCQVQRGSLDLPGPHDNVSMP